MFVGTTHGRGRHSQQFLCAKGSQIGRVSETDPKVSFLPLQLTFSTPKQHGSGEEKVSQEKEGGTNSEKAQSCTQTGLREEGKIQTQTGSSNHGAQFELIPSVQQKFSEAVEKIIAEWEEAKQGFCFFVLLLFFGCCLH
jgi:hypothetical protein